MRFLIKFSYDGTRFNGFQAQKNQRTVEEKMNEALTQVNNGKKTCITATGRTDKGVHALAQYGHADINVEINERQLKRALNSFLPDDIHVIETREVDDDFHARYDAKGKTYRYIMNLGEYNPMERNYAFQYNYDIDVEAMRKAIRYFEGEHDYRAFVTENKEKENCVRSIFYTNIDEEDDKLIIEFEGNGFLRYQVRNMVGYLIKVGEGKATPESVVEVLESLDRTKSGKTAPAQGLYLVDVEF